MDNTVLFIFFVTWALITINTFSIAFIIKWINRVQKSSQKSAPLPLGIKAPDFPVRNLDGKKIRLSDYMRGPIVFIFVSAHCNGCRVELPKIQKLSEIIKEQRSNLDFIVICESGLEDAKRLVEDLQINLSVIVSSRVKSDFLRVYNPSGVVPAFCLIDENGVLKQQGLIGQNEWKNLRQNWEHELLKN